MIPDVVRAYAEEGVRIRMGSPRLRTSGVAPLDAPRYVPDRTPLPLGEWGFSVRDFVMLREIGEALDARRALVIGNACGVSVTSIAAALQPIAVDAIDAEVCGEASIRGAELTRRVARRLDLDVQLTRGFSPQDLDAACRFDAYDLVFVDGLHTNEQIVLDFNGVKDRLAHECAVVFHDIGGLDMDDGWREIRRLSEPLGLEAFDLTCTDFGATALIRGCDGLRQALRATCPALRDFNEHYPTGLGWMWPKHTQRRQVLFVPPGRRVAFFGAGHDLAEYEPFLTRHPELVAGVFDDGAALWGTQRFGIEVMNPQRLASMDDLEAIVVATRAFDLDVRVRAAQLAPDVPLLPLGRFGGLAMEIHPQEERSACA